MAHTLKLNIWKVLFGQPYHKDKLQNSIMLDAIMQNSGVNDPYQAFLTKYIQSFNGKFIKNGKGNKSFGPTSNIKVKSDRHIIHGFLQGGTTGIELKVKPNSNFKAPGNVVKTDDVVEIDHYFLIWIPPNVNYGYIMLQSYMELHSGIAGPFFEHFSEFIQNNGFILRAKQFKIPAPIKEAFRKRSIIVGMDIIKNKTSPAERSRFNPAFHTSERMRYRISVKGLSFSVDEFRERFKKDSKGNPFFIDLSEIGLTSPEDYIASVEYREINSTKKTNAKLTDILNITPTIVLPDDIKVSGSEYPDIDKIFVFCNSQLKQLQLEDGYATIDEFQTT